MTTKIPVECAKWITASDVLRLYPDVSYATMNRMFREGAAWPMQTGTNATGKVARFAERDAFDRWVKENGLPMQGKRGVGGHGGGWRPVDVVWRVRLGADGKPVVPEPPPVLSSHKQHSARGGRRRGVRARQDAMTVPSRVVHWGVVQDVLEALLKNGSPSGNGRDLDHLRWLVSQWILDTHEEVDPRVWEVVYDDARTG